jgi:fumarate reductase subunit C
MKLIKNFFKAFSYISPLFKILWQTDKLYLLYTICETFAFSMLVYPPLILVKYAIDALENKTNYKDYLLVVLLLLAFAFLLNLFKTYFNNVRPRRQRLLEGRLTTYLTRKKPIKNTANPLKSMVCGVSSGKICYGDYLKYIFNILDKNKSI